MDSAPQARQRLEDARRMGRPGPPPKKLALSEWVQPILTDIADGHLALDDRSIPLADPVRERLARRLDHRAAKWPNSQNPHLIVNQRSAPRLMAANRTYPWQ